ncbi:MAG: STAS domain-containing protein [Stenomitos frigidus ULC029]
MTLLHKTLAYEGDIVQLHPPVNLDSYGIAVLQQQISAAKSKAGDVWVIDMAQVEFINSAGILALISAFTLARRANCRLLVSNLRPAIKLVFEITQLDQALEIIDGNITLAKMNPQEDRSLIAA